GPPLGPAGRGAGGHAAPGPAAPGRGMGMTLRLAPHRATTRHLSSAYLLQAEVALPCPGPVVGLDALSGQPFSFDPFALYAEGVITNPNLLVLGQLGTGKSTLAKLLCWGLSALCGHGLAVLHP